MTVTAIPQGEQVSLLKPCLAQSRELRTVNPRLSVLSPANFSGSKPSGAALYFPTARPIAGLRAYGLMMQEARPLIAEKAITD